MAGFIGYPRRKLLAVLDSPEAADAALAAVEAAGVPSDGIERFVGAADADRFDATGRQYGLVAKALRAMQFSLMDQLPAMAWYEAALRGGRTVVAVRTTGDRAATLRAVEALRGAGGHFINRFGRLATEEFVRWRGAEPAVATVMKH